GNVKSSLLTKSSGDMLQGEAVFRQPSQGKQDFSLKYFDDYSRTEKTGRIEPQALNTEGGKVLPGIGGTADVAQVNRPVVDNKTDVPAITKPLSHPEWNKDLGDRIVWMSNKAIPTAEIRLNPQHLGPISVRVNVADDQATVVFTAQHAAVRETLEASIPKLREMMSAQNLNLADVNVTQSPTSDQGRSQSQNFAQSFADGRQQGAPGAAAVDGVDEIEQEIESGRAVVSKGVLSIYA
ncbi:MAG: flagellar hook-length control protein FliK, partial [Methylobacter sp.]